MMTKGNTMPKIVDRNIFLNAAKTLLGEDTKTITRKQIAEVCQKQRVDWPNWLTGDKKRRVSWGVYSMDEITKDETKDETKDDSVMTQAAMVGNVVSIHDSSSTPTTVDFVPAKAQGYVPFGHFADVRSIIKSKKFYPMYITGLSGNGKTMMVEQCCAFERRELIRANITIETDEDDLLGGFRLVDGRTVWQDGPVIVAMQRGAVLLLDEVDLGSNKLMCLQPVLEGKGIFLKKVGRRVEPAPGFNIIATANTKGKGSDDGRFVGTNVMNEAFLERFSITLEQEYPPVRSETKILINILQNAGIPDTDFIDKLVSWADVVRKSFKEGAVSDIISTRRLVHICEAFVIFNGDREKAIQLCLNRFDEDTKVGFMDLYKKLDETVVPNDTTVTSDPIDESVPF